MNLGYRAISYITFAYLVFFAVLTFTRGNSEFLLYTIALALVVYVAARNKDRLRLHFQFSRRIVISLSLLGFVSLASGAFNIKGDRLLNVFIIPDLLKVQDVLHVLFMFVIALVSYIFLKPYLFNEKMGKSWIGRAMLSLTVMMIVGGIGALLEVIQLIASLSFESAQVGGYLPNAFDHLYNFIGAGLATFFLPTRPEHDPIEEGDWASELTKKYPSL